MSTLLFCGAGCKKENLSISASLQGLWELTQGRGMITINYPPGNGHTIRFTGNQYEMSLNGQITKSGQYEIIKDGTVTDATCLIFSRGRYTDRIIYDNDVSAAKVFLEVSGNKLSFVSGCFAYDAGSFSDYTRQ